MDNKGLIEQLILNKVIEEHKIDGTVFHNIALPAKAIFHESVIKLLIQNYKIDEEIGGFAICEPQKVGDSVHLHFNNIHFIPNASDKPQISYTPYNNEKQSKTYEGIMQSYFQNGFLPLRFHTHPIGIQDIIQNKFEFIRQLETSPRDQVTSLIHRKIEQIKLRLPDILVVKEGGSLFVGLYGGLICPIKFDKSKQKTISNTLDKIGSDISNWADTPEKKVGITLGTLGLVFLAIRYPKIVIPSAIASAAMIPTIIFEHQLYPKYFVITEGIATSIELPKIDKTEMLKSEKQLNEIKISLDKKK